jgi:hypothetical protein
VRADRGPAGERLPIERGQREQDEEIAMTTAFLESRRL